MSKRTKIFFLVLCVLVSFTILAPNSALAGFENPITGESDPTQTKNVKDAQNEKKKAAEEAAKTDTFSTTRFDDDSVYDADNVAQNAVGTAINVIRIVGTGIAIIMLTYMAITYMMAAPQEKAEFKKSATIYVVGAVLIFAGSNILTVIVNFATNNIG